MVTETHIEYYFLRKLQESVVNTAYAYMPLLSKHLNTYVSDGRLARTSTNWHPTRIDQFTEVKVIHISITDYMRVDIWNGEKGAAAVNTFKRGMRNAYISHLRRKDRVHFGTTEGARGPLEDIFRKVDFKPLVFSSVR
jgi:hypothetical protein